MQNEAIEPGVMEDNPVAKQVFKPSSWLNNIDHINHLVLFNNVMIAVLADQGAGKTTFAELLESDLDSQIKTQVMKATASFSQAEFLAQLNDIFHFHGDGEISLAELVNQVNEHKAHVIIIIDDAHCLAENFLQEILHALMAQGETAFFHICLIADFSLALSLNTLEPSLIHTLEPGVLTKTETKTYLVNLLHTMVSDEAMSDDRLDQFYQLTGGNIARINSQMTEYFADKPKSRSIARTMGFLATAAIALVASSYIWQNQFLPSSATNYEETEYEHIKAVAEIAQPLPSLMPVIPMLEKEILVSQLPDINHELLNRPSQIPGWLTASIRQQVQPSPKRIVDITLDDDTDDSLVVRDRVVVIPKTIHVTKPKSAPKIAAIPPKVLHKVGQAKFVSNQLTIQLLASRKRDEVMRFVNNHKMNANTKIRLTTRDGLDWYVLTMGEFGQENAQAVIKSLPPELAQLNPWIRPISSLKPVG